MKLSEAMSFTGNDYNYMSYDELAKVTKAMAEAARRRISRTNVGPAYLKLTHQALGSGRVTKVPGLNMKDGIVRIKQNFKGKNRMSFSELRQLRKALYNYLQDPTSTEKGYKNFNARVEAMKVAQMHNTEIKDLQNSWIEDMNMWDKFDEYIADDDFITFGKNHLDWASDQIYNIIIASGGYKARDNKDVNIKRNFRRRLKQHTALEVYKVAGSRKEDKTGKHYSLLADVNDYEDVYTDMPRFFY